MRSILACLLSALLVVVTGCSQATSHQTPTSTDQGTTSPSAPSTPSTTEPTKTSGLVSQELTVQGIGLGSFREDVEKVLGKPDQVDKAPQQNLEFWVYQQTGLVVGLSSDGRVHILHAKAPSGARTAKGIGIGSTMADVKAAYGTPEPPSIYRFPGQGVKQVRLEIGSQNDTVTELYFAWGYE